MTLTGAETACLASQRLGRWLATIQPDGSPQVTPAGFRGCR
jgi:hypothetical protein